MKTLHYVIIEATLPIKGLVAVLAETPEDALIEGRCAENWDQDHDFVPLNHYESWQPGLVPDNAENIKTFQKITDM